MNNKIVAIIQARMGSTRLPKKVLMPIIDNPVLWHIVQRLKCVKEIDDVVIATSVKENCNPIEDFCKEYNISYYRGSEDDVLDRFYQAAVKFHADTVIRITGDCPLVDPVLVGKLIELFKSGNYDHCGIATGAGAAKEGFTGRFPDGLDAEIFSMKTLAKAWKNADVQLEREHVTPYIWKRPEEFKLGGLKSEDRDYSMYRWTLDNKEDFELIKWIYEQLYNENQKFDMHDVIALLEKNPHVLEKNRHLIGQEGYDEFWEKK